MHAMQNTPHRNVLNGTVSQLVLCRHWCDTDFENNKLFSSKYVELL